MTPAVSTSSPPWTRSGATPRTRSLPRPVTRGSPRTGWIYPRSDVTEVSTQARVGASGLMEAHAKRNGVFPRVAVEADHRHQERPRGSNVQKVSRRVAVCWRAGPTVSPFKPTSTSVSGGGRLTPSRSCGQSWSPRSLARGMKEL